MGKRDAIKNRPEIIFADVTEDRKIRLTWGKAVGATGYVIERYSKVKEKFVKIGTVDEATLEFTDSSKLGDGVYEYRVGAMKTVAEQRNPIIRRGGGRKVNLSSIPAINITRVSSPKFGSVTVEWEKDENAEGYVINRRVEGMNEAILRGRADKDTFTFVDDTATSGQVYYYDVQSFVHKEDDTVVFSNTGKEFCFVCLDKTEIVSVKSKLAKRVELSVRMTAGADAYILLKSDTEDGEYKEVSRSKGAFDLTLFDKGNRGEKGAYYCVCCLKNVGKENFFGKRTKSTFIKYKF